MKYEESLLWKNLLSNFNYLKHFNYFKLGFTEEKLERLKMLTDKYRYICYICKEISENIVYAKDIKS